MVVGVVVVVSRLRDVDHGVVSVRSLFVRRLVDGRGRRRDGGGFQEQSCDRADDVVGRVPETASLLLWVDLVGGGGGGGPGAAASEHIAR